MLTARSSAFLLLLLLPLLLALLLPLRRRRPSSHVILLTVPGATKMQVIKVVKELTGLGLKEAKAIVDGAPKAVKEKVSKAEADDIKKKLEEAGVRKQFEVKDLTFSLQLWKILETLKSKAVPRCMAACSFCILVKRFLQDPYCIGFLARPSFHIGIYIFLPRGA